MKLAALRLRDPGTMSLCPWEERTDGGVGKPSIVTGGNGQIIAGFWASPPDAASSSFVEREDTAEVTNSALLNFGTGVAWWNDVAVVPASAYPAPDLSHFPDPISRMVDEERRRQFTAEGAHFENERAFVVCFTPPSAAVGKLGHMMYRKSGREDSSSRQELALRQFELMLQRFETRAGAALGLRRMQGYEHTDILGRVHQRDELVNYLHFCLTGKTVELNLPAAAMPLSGVVGCADFVPGHTPIVGDHYVSCITIGGFPAESWPGILDGLSTLQLPGGYRFTQRAMPRDETEAVRDIDNKRKFWRQRQSSFFGTILGIGGGTTNADAVEMEKACVVSLALSKSHNVKHCWYSATIVLRNRDPRVLAAMGREVERAVGRCGFASQIETENATDAFLGTLPGNVSNNVKKPIIHTFNAADLAPSSGIWTGRAMNPNPLYPPNSPALMHANTEGGIPYRWNNCVGDNGNFAFFGPPGSGKTTLFNVACLQFLRYQGARIRSVDFKRGMKATCAATGGAYYELGADHGPAFCPFEHLETGTDRAWAQEWTETAFELQHGKPCSPDQRSAIHRMVEMLRTEHVRSITNALMLCHDDEVSAALEFYALGTGPGGRLFDADGSDVAESHWDAYDITDVMSAGDKILLPTLMCLEHRFDRIEDGRPILETIDEAWGAVSHPRWRPRLRQRWKTKRSKVVSIGIATQNLADIINKEAGDGGLLSILLESVPTRVYGANPEAQLGGTDDEKGPADFYRAFGLRSQQREVIRTLEKAREYFITSPEGRRAVNFGFGPAALAFAGATGEEEVRKVDAYIAQHGDQWPWKWLADRGVDYASLAAR